MDGAGRPERVGAVGALLIGVKRLGKIAKFFAVPRRSVLAKRGREFASFSSPVNTDFLVASHVCPAPFRSA